MNGRAFYIGRQFVPFLAILLPVFAALTVSGMIAASAMFPAPEDSGALTLAALFIGLASAALAGTISFGLSFYLARHSNVSMERIAWASMTPPQHTVRPKSPFPAVKAAASAPVVKAAAPAPLPAAPPPAPARQPVPRAKRAPRAPRRRYQPKMLPAPGAAAQPKPKSGHLVAMNTAVSPTGGERNRIVKLLKQALAEGHLRLFYQPIVSLDGLQLVGAEALLRIQTPDNAILPPTEIIRVAEESGLMGELGAWVLAEGLSMVDELDAIPGLGMQYLSINLSPRQLDPVFMASLTASLTRAPEMARRVVFEVTETVLLEGDERMIASFHEIRATGARIALDDFGKGYASLGYVNHYPVDIIKLDRSFIHNLSAGGERARKSLALVKAASVMARELGIDMVAEGIETTDELDAVRALRIGYGQGYLFAPPMPETEYREWAAAFSGHAGRLPPPARLIAAA